MSKELSPEIKEAMNIALVNWSRCLSGSAVTDTYIDPENVSTYTYGNHISYVDGEKRYWRFQEKRGYFRFLGYFYEHLIDQY